MNLRLVDLIMTQQLALTLKITSDRIYKDNIWRILSLLTDVIFYLIENRLCTTYLWNLFAHWYLVVNYKCDIPPNSQNPELFGCMIVATLYFMKISRNFDFRNLVFYKWSKIPFQICGPLQHFERLCATCWHLNY